MTSSLPPQRFGDILYLSAIEYLNLGKTMPPKKRHGYSTIMIKLVFQAHLLELKRHCPADFRTPADARYNGQCVSTPKPTSQKALHQ